LSFGRQKRLLLGWLALLAPLPLPFNGMVLWPVLALYLAGVVYFLRRASLDPPRWLPRWAMNVLGLAYLPIFFLDLTAFSRGRLVQPAIHLCLFALLVKLFSMTRERDKWQTAMGIFFLFLAAMGTSVHPAIVLYLVAFLVLSLVLLARFAFLHVLAGFGREDPSLARLPMRGFLWASALCTLLLAVPLFALLPRVRAPFIVGRSPGTGMTMEAAGFSDEVTLDSIGNIRGSRQVALRLLDEGRADPDREIRFKGATYDLYQGGSWRRSPVRGPLQRQQGVRFVLSRAEPERWVRIWLRPLRSRSLPLPVEAAVIEPRVPRLEIDQGGAVAMDFDPFETVEYRVGLAGRPVLLGTVPGPAPDPTLDLAGVTPRIAALAETAMRGVTAAEKARRLERYLMQNYDYTLDFRGRSAENPIEDFLFRYRSGQCEYFATSMVLMLRSQGIPARLATGFLGGEYNPFEGYYIVRDSNAHAWVEAYLPDAGGWRVFDPTPPAGRPEGRQESAWLLAQQAWDFMLFRWDRYVLTFGLYDQIRLFGSLRAMWSDFWGIFEKQDRGREEGGRPAGTDTGQPSEEGSATDPGSALESALPYLIGIALLAAFCGFLAWRLRSPLTATVAYRRLRHRLGRSGTPLPDSLPPLALSRETAARFPEAARPAARIIDFYLRESFGGHPLREDEREALKEALAEAERGMRKAG
jgi:transglutaminase-like putative cysteine protease